MTKKKSFGFKQNEDAQLDLGKESQFPGMGFNHSDGTWYIDGEEYEGVVKCSVLAVRRCKETISYKDNVLHRYPIRTKKIDMIDGYKPTKQKGRQDAGSVQRVQVLLRLRDKEDDNQLKVFAFGSSAYTGNMCWFNPRSGNYRLEDLGTGIWYQLQDWVSQVESQYNEVVPYYCWEFDLQIGKKFVVNSEVGTKAHPFELVADFNPDMFDAEMAEQNEQFIIDNKIQDWVDEWQKQQSVEPTLDIDDADWDDDEEPVTAGTKAIKL